MRGTRPPPCRNFTFVCINERQALLYGGYLPEGKLRVSDLYLFDFSDSEAMVCNKTLRELNTLAMINTTLGYSQVGAKERR